MKRWQIIFWALLAALLAISWFGPRERVDWSISFAESDLGAELDAYLARMEGLGRPVQDGLQKEIIWAGAPDTKTALSLVYVHGFAASRGEIGSVVADLATELGANAYYARLTGHGQGPDGMQAVSANDWINDAVEAIAIGQRIGDRVVIITSSLGGTLTALVASDPFSVQHVAGFAFLSPNFGLKTYGAGLLGWPFGRVLAPLALGETQSQQGLDGQAAKARMLVYPTTALFPVSALVDMANTLPFETMRQPAFFAYRSDDPMVDAARTRVISEIWAGPVTYWPLEGQEGGDAALRIGDAAAKVDPQALTGQLRAWINGL